MKSAADCYDKPFAVVSGVSTENNDRYNRNIAIVPASSTSIDVESCNGIFIHTNYKEIADIVNS